MWGEVLQMKILLAAATSANQVDPGQISRFRDGTIARYIQGAATLDNDTLAVGEPALLLPAASAWNDPYKLYLATNVSDAAGAVPAMAVGPYIMAGIAAVAIPEGYWGWAVIRGYMSNVRCYDTAAAAWDHLVLDIATTTVDGMSLKQADADGQMSYGYALAADDGTAHTVAAFVNADGYGCVFDIA